MGPARFFLSVKPDKTRILTGPVFVTMDIGEAVQTRDGIGGIDVEDVADLWKGCIYQLSGPGGFSRVKACQSRIAAAAAAAAARHKTTSSTG